MPNHSIALVQTLLVVALGCFEASTRDREESVDAGTTDAAADAPTADAEDAEDAGDAGPEDPPAVELLAYSSHGRIRTLAPSADRSRFYGYFAAPLELPDRVIRVDSSNAIAVDGPQHLALDDTPLGEVWASERTREFTGRFFGEDFFFWGYHPEGPDDHPRRSLGFVTRMRPDGTLTVLLDDVPRPVDMERVDGFTMLLLPFNPETPLTIRDRTFSTSARNGLVLVGIHDDGRIWSRLVYEGIWSSYRSAILLGDELTCLLYVETGDIAFGSEVRETRTSSELLVTIAAFDLDGELGTPQTLGGASLGGSYVNGSVLTLCGFHSCEVIGTGGRILWRHRYRGFVRVRQTTSGTLVAALRDENTVVEIALLDDTGVARWEREFSAVDARPTPEGVWIAHAYGPDRPLEFDGLRREAFDEALAFSFLDASGRVTFTHVYDEAGDDTFTRMVAVDRDQLYALVHSEHPRGGAVHVLDVSSEEVAAVRVAGVSAANGCRRNWRICRLEPHIEGVDVGMAWEGTLTLLDGRRLVGESESEFVSHNGAAVFRVRR